jgi:hypothetical protein
LAPSITGYSLSDGVEERFCIRKKMLSITLFLQSAEKLMVPPLVPLGPLQRSCYQQTFQLYQVIASATLSHLDV